MKVLELIKNGLYKQAELLLKSKPNKDALDFSYLATIYLEQNILNQEVADYINTALKLRPNLVEGLIAKSVFFLKCNDNKNAQKIAEQILNLNSNNLEAIFILCRLNFWKNNLDIAQELAQQILSNAPEHSEANAYMAKILISKNQNNITEASVYINKAITTKPFSIINQNILLEIVYLTNKHDDNLIKTLKQLEPKIFFFESNPKFLYYSLYKLYKDLNLYDKSSDMLIKANLLSRQNNNFDENLIEQLHQKVKNIFNQNFINFYQENHNQDIAQIKPIFIVGMPRSGTTLIEQILTTNSQIYGTQEYIQFFKKFQFQLETQINQLNFTLLAQQYEATVKDFMQKNKSDNYVNIIVDKYLDNYLWIGLIVLTFPRAKIINCQRHPLDTCLACFERNFIDIPWSYSLSEIANQYNRYRDLMNHWHTLLPNTILDVQYENIVLNTEAEIQRILEYCDLTWNEDYLKFYNQKRNVNTSSKYQVSKPIYQNSINKWKNYPKLTTPLRQIIKKEYLN